MYSMANGLLYKIRHHTAILKKFKCIDLTKLMSAIGINIKLKSIFGVMPKLFILK